MTATPESWEQQLRDAANTIPDTEAIDDIGDTEGQPDGITNDSHDLPTPAPDKLREPVVDALESAYDPATVADTVRLIRQGAIDPLLSLLFQQQINRTGRHINETTRLLAKLDYERETAYHLEIGVDDQIKALRAEIDQAHERADDLARQRDEARLELTRWQSMFGDVDTAQARLDGLEAVRQALADHITSLYQALGWPADLDPDDALSRAGGLHDAYDTLVELCDDATKVAEAAGITIDTAAIPADAIRTLHRELDEARAEVERLRAEAERRDDTITVLRSQLSHARLRLDAIESPEPAPARASIPTNIHYRVTHIAPGSTYPDEPSQPVPSGWWVTGWATTNDECPDVQIYVEHAADNDGNPIAEEIARKIAAGLADAGKETDRDQ